MNDTYLRLKKEYDDITKQISSLYTKQRNTRELMEQACIHNNLIEVDSDPFLETKYKCKDCFRYFTQEEFLAK